MPRELRQLLLWIEAQVSHFNKAASSVANRPSSRDPHLSQSNSSFTVSISCAIESGSVRKYRALQIFLKMIQVFLDCDGVLADFDTAATQLLGQHPRKVEEEIGSDAFWRRLEEVAFFRDLPLMNDAREQDEIVVRYSILHESQQIFASKYMLYQQRKNCETSSPGSER